MIIPVYNRWPVVEDAIYSALQQTFPPWEVIVVDDGSTDGIAHNVRRQHPQVKVIQQANAERGAARNTGAAAAAGDYLCFLDSDDVLMPNHLASVAAYLEAGHQAVCTGARMWDPLTGVSWPAHIDVAGSARPLLQRALWGTPAPPSCTVISRCRFAEVGGYPEARRIAGSEDWLFMVALAEAGEIAATRGETVLIRAHEERSMSDPARIIASRFAALEVLLSGQILRRTLSPAEEALARGGAARFAAAHHYEAGQMKEARAALRAVSCAAGYRRAVRSGLRLYAQSLLGARAVGWGRSVRQLLRERRTHGAVEV